MKSIALLVLFTCSLFSGMAQIEKGTWALGGSGGGGLVTGNAGYTFILNLSPSIGYFPKKNLFIGSTINTGVYTFDFGATQGRQLRFDAQISSRYYFNFGREREKNEYTWKPFSVYPEISIGHQLLPANFLRFNPSISPGIGCSIFLTPNIALDGKVQYSYFITGFNSGFNLSYPIGFTYYFR